MFFFNPELNWDWPLIKNMWIGFDTKLTDWADHYQQTHWKPFKCLWMTYGNVMESAKSVGLKSLKRYPSLLKASSALGPSHTSPFIRGVKCTPRNGRFGSGTYIGDKREIKKRITMIAIVCSCVRVLFPLLREKGDQSAVILYILRVILI